MSTMSNEEFEKIYGRPPVRVNRKKKPKIYWGRIIIALIIFILLIIGVVKMVKGIISLFKGDNNSPTQAVVVSQVNEESDTEINNSKLDFKVCLDPGHGDYDAGTTSLDGKRLEKDDTLAIGLKVRQELQNAGVDVIMTRDDDSFLSLEERSDLANKQGADLFVSLHRNAYDGKISGVEIWVHNKKPELDTTLAQNIMDKLDEAGISDNRGVQYGYIGMPMDNYYVNAESHMPSCLVELGFMTDDTDNKLFDEKLDDYAKAISEGVIQSAKDMKIIDENGKRLISQSMISKDKIYDSSVLAEITSSAADTSEFASDSSRIIYNVGENELHTN